MKSQSHDSTLWVHERFCFNVYAHSASYFAMHSSFPLGPFPGHSHHITRHDLYIFDNAMSRCQTTESYRNLGFRRASEGEQNISHRQHQEESSILIFRRGMAMTKNLLRVLVLGND
uniref:Uncharacterized protein n=1 Tax=Panagrolaimus sp. JU765 TaxID=591449 RepID=A0AC34QZ23_9BILA